MRWGTRRVWLVGLLLLLALALLMLTPLRYLFDRQLLVQWLQDWGRGGGQWAIAGFVALYSALTVVGIPGTVLTVAGGAVFGVVWGTAVSVVGATLGAVGAFGLARYGLRDGFGCRFARHEKLAQFDAAVRRYPWSFVLAVRFAPVAPFNFVNFLFGLTSIHVKPPIRLEAPSRDSRGGKTNGDLSRLHSPRGIIISP